MLKLFILVFLFLPTAVAAHDDKADWPSGSSMHTGLTYREHRDYFMKFLLKDELKLEAIVKDVDPDNDRLLKAIAAQHEAWLAYHPKECELIGALSGAGGTWPSTYNLKCQSNLVNGRLKSVRNAITCIQKIPEAERRFNSEKCLYQLAPLATE